MFASLDEMTSYTFQWTHDQLDEDSCSEFLADGLLQYTFFYQVYTSQDPYFLTQTLQCSYYSNSSVLLNSTTFSCSVNSLPTGKLLWKVVVTKETWIGNSFITQSSTASSPFSFSICAPVAPIQAYLQTPVNSYNLTYCANILAFTWLPFINQDFGQVCSPSIESLSLYFELSVSPSFSSLVYSDTLVSTLTTEVISIDILTSYQTYFWRLTALNGVMNTTSVTYQFTVGNMTDIMCNKQGTCILGYCDCNSGFNGTYCQISEPIITGNFSSPTESSVVSPSSFGSAQIVGVVIGVLVALALFVVIAFFVYRRKILQASKIRTKRKLPDFGALAFTSPPSIVVVTDNSPPNVVSQWKLFELFLVTNAQLQGAILDSTQAVEMDAIVRFMLYVCNSHNLAAKFVSDLIIDDVRHKNASGLLESSTLFRENSPASVGFRHLALLKGLPFLFFSIGGVIDDFLTKEKLRLDKENGQENGKSSTGGSTQSSDRIKEGSFRKNNSSSNSLELTPITIRSGSLKKNYMFMDANFEMDSSKMRETDDGQTNSLALQLRCQKLLVGLFKYADLFPQELSSVLACVVEHVSRSLSMNDAHLAVAGFVFLRFINPSILFPTRYGLVPEIPDSPIAKRQLIMIAKVLQNLANGVKFGQKEAFMLPLNGFIDANEASLRRFLENISKDVTPKNTVTPKDVVISVPSSTIVRSSSFSSKKELNKQEPMTDQEKLDAMKPEIPANMVESALASVYNHVYYNRDHVMESLKNRLNNEEYEQIKKKLDPIFSQIGEPSSSKGIY